MDLNASGGIVPSQYALDARAAGLDIIGWTLERSGILGDGEGGFYYQTVEGPNGALSSEGDVYEALDMMFQEIGIIGMFSDWPATVTYYTSCFHIR
jgi:glycerophosphoryl diester phosphodiesterase